MENINKILSKIAVRRKIADYDEIKKEVWGDPDIRKFISSLGDTVNVKIIQNSFASLYAYHVAKNGDKVMEGYRPELFFNGTSIDIRYLATKAKQEADQKLAARNRIKLIDLPRNLRLVNLAKIDKTVGRRNALTLVAKFIEEYKNNSHQRGLYLTGDFGVGKTYILAGLANAVAELEKNVVFLHVPTFIAGLTSHFQDNSLQTEIQKVANCDLLILDDIGAESLSQWSRDDVLGVILQARMDNVLPTFFSSNLDMNSLEKHFSQTKNAIDPVKAARLMERVRFLAKEVVVSGEDRRKF